MSGILSFILPLLANVAFPGLGTIGSMALGAGAGTLGGLIEGEKPKDALMGGITSGLMGGVMGGFGGGGAGDAVGSTASAALRDGVANIPTATAAAGADAATTGVENVLRSGVANTPTESPGIFGNLFNGSSGGLGKNMLPLMMMGMAGMGGGGGSAQSGKKYRPGDHPPVMPAARTIVQPPAGYQPGVSPEWNYGFDGYGGYASGGSVDPISQGIGNFFSMIGNQMGGGQAGSGGTTMIAGHEVPNSVASGLPAGLAGKKGGKTVPTAPTQPPPTRRDPGSFTAPPLIPQSAVPQVTLPTPVQMNYSIPNTAGNLAAARPQGYACGGGIRGYAEGGSPLPQDNGQTGADPNDKALVKAAIQAVMGQTQNARAVLQAFVQRFGQQALEDLIERLHGQPGGRAIQGAGDGLSDSVPAQVDGGAPAKLSTGEFVVPSDAVSHLGNGDNQTGASHLHDMINRLRQARTGAASAPPAVNPQAMMPA